MGFLDRFRKKKEVTPGGSRVYRYDNPEDHGLRLPEAVGVYADEITAHFENLFPGRESFVFHEIVSDLVHIDVHIMRPASLEQPFYVLYTTGMSDLPMTLPSDIPAKDRRDMELSELYLFLPGNWDFGEKFQVDTSLPESSYWPIGLMKFLARFPHVYQTWLGWGHTIPNGPQYAPLAARVGFGGVVLRWGNGPLSSITAKDGRKINFYGVVPAYKEEIEYKLKYGMEGLEKVFQDKKLSMVLDPQRPNFCADFTEVLDG